MKQSRKIIYSILIIIALVCTFLPIATFEDNTIVSIIENITKEEGAVTRAADKLVRENDKVKGLTIAAVEGADLKAQLAAEIEAAKPVFQSRQDTLTEILNWQSALDAKREDIEKQKATGNVTSADLDKEFAASDARYTVMIKIIRQQVALDAMAAEGTDVAAIQKKQDAVYKQLGKVNKEQVGVNKLLAEKEALENNTAADGLKFALLPAKLPAEIQIDMQIVNQGGAIYPTSFTDFYGAIYIGAAMLVIAILLVWAGGSRLASKLYTFASFANLIGVLALFFAVLRLNAIPVKLPFSAPVMNWPLALTIILLPLAALLLHCTSVRNTKRTMIYVLCIALSALSLLPFWLMIVNATRNSQQIQSGVSLIPSTFLSINWNTLQAKHFDALLGFKNSAIIAFGSTILGVYFSSLTAYGLTVYRFKGAKLLYALILAIIMIPGQVTGTGFFMFMYQLEWTNSYLPLIIPAIASASTVFFFKQYLEANFQVSLVEAARIDGAGEFYTFNRIVMPIMIPAMATMGIMAVIGSWNNYLTPLMLLSKSEMKTLPMMVKELRGDIYRTDYGSIYLGLTLTALPLLIVYFALSKYIIAGVAVGGVKE